MTHADEHRAIIEHRWPELGVRTFEPVGDGWDCFTYLVNGEWVFQFPRSADATESLAKQTDVRPIAERSKAQPFGGPIRPM